MQVHPPVWSVSPCERASPSPPGGPPSRCDSPMIDVLVVVLGLVREVAPVLVHVALLVLGLLVIIHLLLLGV